MGDPDLSFVRSPDISPRERADRCRAMAAEATRLARDSTGDVRAAYLTLASQWLALAEEVERSIPEAERS